LILHGGIHERKRVVAHMERTDPRGGAVLREGVIETTPVQFSYATAGAGHSLHDDSPEPVHRLLTAFLDRQTPAHLRIRDEETLW
jgi:hypothetical protein